MNAISNEVSQSPRALRRKKSAHLLRWAVLALLTLYISAAGFAEGDARHASTIHSTTSTLESGCAA